jgi:hypothetical protein
MIEPPCAKPQILIAGKRVVTHLDIEESLYLHARNNQTKMAEAEFFVAAVSDASKSNTAFNAATYPLVLPLEQTLSEGESSMPALPSTAVIIQKKVPGHPSDTSESVCFPVVLCHPGTLCKSNEARFQDDLTHCTAENPAGKSPSSHTSMMAEKTSSTPNFANPILSSVEAQGRTGLEPKILRATSVRVQRLMSATSVAQSRHGIETPLQPPVAKGPRDARSSRKLERLMSASSVAQLHSNNCSIGEASILESSFLRTGSKKIERLLSATSAQSKPNGWAFAATNPTSTGQDEKPGFELNEVKSHLRETSDQPEECTNSSGAEAYSRRDTRNTIPCKEFSEKPWCHAGTVSEKQDTTYIETDAEASASCLSCVPNNKNLHKPIDGSALAPTDDTKLLQVHAEKEMRRNIVAQESTLGPVPLEPVPAHGVAIDSSPLKATSSAVCVLTADLDEGSSPLDATGHIRPLSSAFNSTPTSVGHARMIASTRCCKTEEPSFSKETKLDQILVFRNNHTHGVSALPCLTILEQFASSKVSEPMRIESAQIQDTNSTFCPTRSEHQQDRGVDKILDTKNAALNENIDTINSLPDESQMQQISIKPQENADRSTILVSRQKDFHSDLGSVELAQGGTQILLNADNVEPKDLQQGDIPSDRPRDEKNHSFAIFERVAQLYPTSAGREPSRELQDLNTEHSPRSKLDQGADGVSWIAAAASSGSSSSSRRARLVSRDQMLAWVGTEDRKQGSEQSNETDENMDFADNLDPTEFSISPSSASRLNFDLDRSPVLARSLTEDSSDARKSALKPDVIVRRPIGTSVSSFGRISSGLTESSEHLQAKNHGFEKRGSIHRPSSKLGHRSLKSSGQTTNQICSECQVPASCIRPCERVRVQSDVMGTNIPSGKAVRRNSIGSLVGTQCSQEVSIVGNRDGNHVLHQNVSAGSSPQSQSETAPQVPGSKLRSEESMRKRSVHNSTPLSPQRKSKTRLAFGARGFAGGHGMLSLLAPRSSVLSRAGPDVPEAARTEFTVAYPVAYTADLLATVCQDSLGLRVFRRTSGDKLRVERADNGGPHLVAAVLLQIEREGVTHVRIRASRSDRGRTSFAALWTFYDDLVTQLEMLAHDTATAHAVRNDEL